MDFSANGIYFYGNGKEKTHCFSFYQVVYVTLCFFCCSDRQEVASKSICCDIISGIILCPFMSLFPVTVECPCRGNTVFK